jgi:peptide/nickel transport system permease protein
MNALKDVLWHLTLPAIVLGMYSMAIIARMTRSSLLEVLSQDYIRTAKAKGLNSKQIVMRHGLRNGLIPVITVIGLQFGTMLGGALLTESVFSWPGIGAYTVSCILKSDFPVVQGVVLLVATIFVTLNLLVDIIYAVVDPRIKYGKKEE